MHCELHDFKIVKKQCTPWLRKVKAKPGPWPSSLVSLVLSRFSEQAPPDSREQSEPGQAGAVCGRHVLDLQFLLISGSGAVSSTSFSWSRVMEKWLASSRHVYFFV